MRPENQTAAVMRQTGYSSQGQVIHPVKKHLVSTVGCFCTKSSTKYLKDVTGIRIQAPACMMYVCFNQYLIYFCSFLADRTDARSMSAIGMILSCIRLSVHLSVTKCIVALRVSVQELSAVPSMKGHFVFTSSDTFAVYRLARVAVGCITFGRNTRLKSKPPKFPRLEQAWAVWSLDVAIPDAAFLAVRFCSYTIRHMRCNWPSVSIYYRAR